MEFGGWIMWLATISIITVILAIIIFVLGPVGAILGFPIRIVIGVLGIAFFFNMIATVAHLRNCDHYSQYWPVGSVTTYKRDPATGLRTDEKRESYLKAAGLSD